jgi:flotillin
VKKAEFKVKADSKKAEADKALEIALADQEKTLRVKQADRDAAEREAQIKVQEKEAQRMQKELEATVVKQAEAERQRRIIEAEGAKQQRILEAEAEMQKMMKEAEGRKNADTFIGEGEAAKTRATLFAIAEGEAAKKKQALLAEAEGTSQLAAALAKMTTDAKLILVLDRLPVLFDRGGDALSKVAESVFSSVAAPLGSIDRLEIVDMGSGRGIENLSSIVPNTVFKTLAAAKAQGIDVSKLLSTFGVNIDDALAMLGKGTTPETPKEGQKR